VFEEANASLNLPQQDRTLVDKIKLYGSKPPYPADRITPVLPPNPNQRERKREIHSTPLQPLPELALPIRKLKNRSTCESPQYCPLAAKKKVCTLQLLETSTLKRDPTRHRDLLENSLPCTLRASESNTGTKSGRRERP
jgi:hypothetical protein